MTIHCGDGPSGLLSAARDPLGNVTSNRFDDAGNLIATWLLQGPGNAEVAAGSILSTNSFAYDANGNRPISVVWRHLGTNWVGATNITLFDAQDRAIGNVDPLGHTNLTILDAAGRAIATVDKMGNTNRTEFDFRGNPVKTIFPDGTSISSGFDPNGHRTNTLDQFGHETKFLLNALGNQVATVFADNTTNWSIPDQLGRVIYTVDARGTTNAFGYDRAGQRITTTNALRTDVESWTVFGFDVNGNNVTVTNALNVVTTNIFDLVNRQIGIRFPDGTSIWTGFDPAGNKVSETNQDAVVTLFGNDGAGRLNSVTNALATAQQIVTRYEHDETGKETAQIDANNHTNRSETDALGRRTKHILPGGQSESWGYDPNGNEIRHTNFNGIVITNQFDVMNRNTNRLSTNGYHIAWTFTLTGQRQTMLDASGLSTYVYDVLDRLRTNQTPAGTLFYAYDLNGDPTNVWSSTANGINLVKVFDRLHRLKAVTNVVGGAPTLAALYARDTLGNVLTVALGNGITSLSSLDLLSRQTNLTWKLNTNLLADFSYSRGRTGNITNLAEVVNGVSRTNRSQQDRLYRLTNEVLVASSGGTNAYSLDAVGNRLALTATIPGTSSQTNTFDSNDRLGSDTYDPRGNTIASAGNTFGYDPEDRLISATVGGTNLTFTYNGDGIRVAKAVSGTTTLYLVDAQSLTGYPEVLEEKTVSAGATNLARVYAYGLSLITQREGSGTVYYFVADGHGSTRLLTSASGAVSNAFWFDAYGVLIGSKSPPQTAYLYPGEQFDFNAGMYYLRARYYAPSKGRFWTADAFEGIEEEPLSLHRFIYCHGDPVGSTDPSGNFEFDATFGFDWAFRFSLLHALADAARPVTIQVTTVIRPPDPKAGVKTKHIIAVNGFGSVASVQRYVGNTEWKYKSLAGKGDFNELGPESEFPIVKVGLTAAAKAVGLPPGAKIRYGFDVALDFQKRAGHLSGFHELYPSYTVTVAGKQVYDYQQSSFAGLSGVGLPEVEVSFSW